MDTDSRSRIPFHVRLPAMLTLALTLLAGSCIGYLYFCDGGTNLALTLRTHWIFVVCMSVLTALLCAIAYLSCRSLGRSMERLRLFADRADRGLPVEDIASFPDDELGDISSQVVRLYASLRQTRKELLSEQEIALRQEQEQIRVKRQLTQNINHELKTPVSSIQGYLETILNNPAMPPQTLMSFVEKSYGQTQRLSQLLSDVSTLTRLDDGRQVIEKRMLNLSELIAETVSDTAAAAADRGMSVSVCVPGDIWLPASHSMLSSVFRNLMDNAIAYSGGRNIVITLVRMERDVATLSFADDGAGVAPEHLPHLFERFYRVDKGRSRRSGGTGLGLAIVKNAVLLHGGSISAHLREMGGLEFLFTLGGACKKA